MIVHYMRHGQTACAKPGVPKTWESGHMWSGDWDDVDCPQCLTTRLKGKRRSKRKLTLYDKAKTALKASAQPMPKRKLKKAPKAEPTYTLEDIVKAAHKQGMKIDIKLLPKELAPTLEYLRPLLNLPADKWPGNPGCRSIIAGLDITRKDIEKAFKDNPSSQWIITPFEIVQREAFFAPPPKLKATLSEEGLAEFGPTDAQLASKEQSTTTPNPS